MAKNIQFLRNQTPLANKTAALAKLNTVLGGQAEGAPAIVSYGNATDGYAALFGFKFANGVQIFEGIKYTVPEGGGTPTVEVPEEVKNAIEAAINGIKGTATNSFDTLGEIETIIKSVIGGAGLNEDGSFSANTNATYVSGATDIVDAIDKLDTALKNASNASDAIRLVALTAEEVNTLGDANVKEAYKLVGTDGSTAKGAIVKINKDQTLKEVKYADQVLTFTYILADGSESNVPVDMTDLIQEAEMGDGMYLVDHKITVKVNDASEAFLTVGADGVKLEGVQDAIDAAKTAVGAYTVNGSAISGNPVVNGANAKLSAAYTVATTAAEVAAEDTIDIAFGKLAKSVKDLDTELNGGGSTGAKVYLTKVIGSDAIVASEKEETNNTQTISLKINAADPMLEIDATNGLQIKESAVFDAGTYA